jgi:hypothetical protein
MQPAWSITTIEDTFGAAGPGGVSRIKRVNFTYDGSQSSYVDVPLTPDWVKVAVDAVAKHAQELMALRGTHAGNA